MYEFRLYVVDATPSSKKAIASVNSLLEDEFKEAYSLEVIDLFKNPQLAERESVFATPTLVKVLHYQAEEYSGISAIKKRYLLAWRWLMADKVINTNEHRYL